jgi:acetoacetyl-CoA synthetase
VAVYGEDGKPVVGQKGEMVCLKPFPAMPLYFYGDK